MTFPQDLPPDFIAYCDESGDPGRKKSASDWFIVSAVLVKAAREPDIARWVQAIKRPMRNKVNPDLHFYKLDQGMRYRASRMLGKLPVRCFTVLSHKANMINYRNERVEQRYAWRDYEPDGETYTISPRNAWFHNWLLKLLLERVTAFCADYSMRNAGKIRTVRVIIARKGGFYIEDFMAYLHVDRVQYSAGSGILNRYLDWRVIDLKEVHCLPAAQVPGLQLADIVCGSFLRAVDATRFGQCDRTHSTNLMPRMAIDRATNLRCDFSVMAWPRPLSKAKLDPQQIEVFKDYGYKENWLVRPGPRTAGR